MKDIKDCSEIRKLDLVSW